jgi:NTP pyrophosphatase (non-canonical NTP hydrolase)
MIPPPGDNQTTLAQLKDLMADFVARREWNRYHTPKNLTMSLAVEAAELMEHFQWLTAEEARRAVDDAETAEAVADEMADVLAFLLSLANATGVDLADSFRRKMAKNELKYPVDEVKGHYRRPVRRQ